MNQGLVGVVGAGTMGSGIAQKYATCGFQVVLIDENQATLMRSRNAIESTLHEGVTRGVFKAEEALEILHRISFSTDLNSLSHAILVIEAIFEDRMLKAELFRNIESIVSKDALLATNTSSLRVADLQTSLRYPERFIGLHYFYHPAKNRLVELICTAQTPQAIKAQALALQERIHKIVIESKDSPGFIVNRFFVPWLNEAVRMAHEGMASIATIEAATKDFFKIGMGPFELMNVTGLPITFHSAHMLAQSFGEFYTPCPSIASHMEAKRSWSLEGDVYEHQFEEISLRLAAVVSSISTQLVYDEQVCSIHDVDLGARVGLLWQKGPCEMYNDVHKKLDTVKLPHHALPPSRSFAALRKEGSLIPLSHVIVEKHQSVGILRLHKPDTLNALDTKMLDDLRTAFYGLRDDPFIDAIIIIGHQRAFMAGADLGFFSQNLQARTIETIVNFAQAAQDFYLDIDQCAKPTVAAISGLALGGGLELALACDKIIATKRSKLAFPETGIGIYPGLGGTQRTPARIGIALARYLILTGVTISGEEAKAMGLVDYTCEEAELLEKALLMAKAELSNSDAPSPLSFHDIRDAFEDFDPHQPMAEHDNERVVQAFARIKKKAPLAIKAADFLIRSTEKHDLAAGLQQETSHLSAIFHSDDAKRGISGALAREKVAFLGT